MTGRPTLLTPDVQATIVKNLASGCTIKDAAMAAGVHQDSYGNWMRRGAAYAEHLEHDGSPLEAEEPFLSFFRDVTEARARGRVRNAALISKAAETDWRAAAWYLERVDPESWGRTNRTEISGRDGGPVRVVATSDSDILDMIEAQLAAVEVAELESE